MPIGQEELARRLRAAREACHLTQEDVARHLDLSRSTVAQMELGNRAVTSLELDKLAYLYGRDIREFLADDFREEDALVAVFRRHPEVSEQERVFQALRECLALGREVTNLERHLGIDRDFTALAAYRVRSPNTKWEAIQQGERIAAEERRRLGLGKAPLPNVSELLEGEGVRTAQASLPEDVSGLTIVQANIGVLVVVNRDHHFWRRRFSFAHEYCHVVLDREQKSTISTVEDRESLPEVRANAFSAALLMPKEGVEEFMYSLAKGRPSRLRAEVFDEKQPVVAQARSEPGSQAVQMYDVVLLAHHFGVSCIAALYRLKNLKLLNDSEFEGLKDQEGGGVGRELARVLELAEPDAEETRNEFRRRFLALALEAFRRGTITRRKLSELSAMVEISGEDVDRILGDAGLDEQDETFDVLVPQD